MDKRKRVFLEAGFFIFYFFVLQILTDVQYIQEFKNESLRDNLLYRLFNVPLVIGIYFIFYKFQLPLLFQKKHVRFFLSVLVFMGLLECYLYLLDWLNYHNPFMAESSKAAAATNLKNPMFPRQMLTLTIRNLLMLTGFGYFIKRMEDLIRMRQLKEQHLELELQYLKAQLQPHFFFNTLNNIYSLALDNADDTAPTVAKLAELMRYIIYDGNKKQVPLVKEIEFINNYMELERIRHNEKTVIHFTIEGDPGNKMIEPLLFIPLVENGFKHGVHSSINGAWLKACLQIGENDLQFKVANASTHHQPAKTGGMGLANTYKRLQLLYPQMHSLQVVKDENSFTALLKLQLQ